MEPTTAPTRPITDLAYILGLGQTERRALGFIPAPAIAQRCIQPGRYLTIRDRHGRRRGFLLYGPLNPGRPVHIYQTCVEPDYRLRTYAARAVTELARRALAAGCTSIDLRCALDLTANAFWTALGFSLVRYEIGGRQKERAIARYTLPLGPDSLSCLPARFW